VTENEMEKTQENSTRPEDRKLDRAQKLSLASGCLIMSNSVLLGAAARWFPGVIPILLGPAGNSKINFAELTVEGLMIGALVLLGAVMLFLRPANSKVWGLMVAVCSVPSVITGGGFIVGVFLGVIGGATALSRKKSM
jgi:hypothetical protein